MSIITENDCFVEKIIFDEDLKNQKAGIIDFSNKTILMIKGDKIFEYSKIIDILTHQYKLDIGIKKLFFKITPLSRSTIINGWLIKNKAAHSFIFQYELGEYDNLNLDYRISWKLIPNYGYPSNNKINKSLFTYSPVAFLCLNAVGLYSIKYLKP